MARVFPTSAAILLSWFILLQGAWGGLRDGEAFALASFASQSTLGATDSMDVRAQYPPPETGRAPSGIAVISGDMSSVYLNTTALLSSSTVPIQIGAASSSRVDFHDTITLNAAGLNPGAKVIVRIAWNVSGSVSSSSSSNLVTSSRILLSAPPLLLGNPPQTWTRESNNTGEPVTYEPAGRVEFDFVVKIGTPIQGNIVLTAATEAVSFVDSENIPTSYSASPGSSLTLQFEEVVSVQSLSGFAIPVWTIESESLFDYGEGDGPLIPTQPDLTISLSSIDPSFISCCWPSSPFEYYTIEHSTNLLDWSLLTMVNGTGAEVDLELFKPAGDGFYRLVSHTGSASPDSTLTPPNLRLYPSPAGSGLLRVAWMSSIHESYVLQRSANPEGGWTDDPPRTGTGGVLFTDVPVEDAQRFFQLSCQLTAIP